MSQMGFELEAYLWDLASRQFSCRAKNDGRWRCGLVTSRSWVRLRVTHCVWLDNAVYESERLFVVQRFLNRSTYLQQTPHEYSTNMTVGVFNPKAPQLLVLLSHCTFHFCKVFYTIGCICSVNISRQPWRTAMGISKTTSTPVAIVATLL